MSVTGADRANFSLVQVAIRVEGSEGSWKTRYLYAERLLSEAQRMNEGRLVTESYIPKASDFDSPVDFRFFSFPKDRVSRFLDQVRDGISRSREHLQLEARMISSTLLVRVELEHPFQSLCFWEGEPRDLSFWVPPWDFFDPGRTLTLQSPFSCTGGDFAARLLESDRLDSPQRRQIDRLRRAGIRGLKGYQVFVHAPSLHVEGWTHSFRSRYASPECRP